MMVAQMAIAQGLPVAAPDTDLKPVVPAPTAVLAVGVFKKHALRADISIHVQPAVVIIQQLAAVHLPMAVKPVIHQAQIHAAADNHATTMLVQT